MRPSSLFIELTGVYTFQNDREHINYRNLARIFLVHHRSLRVSDLRRHLQPSYHISQAEIKRAVDIVKEYIDLYLEGKALTTQLSHIPSRDQESRRPSEGIY